MKDAEQINPLAELSPRTLFVLRRAVIITAPAGAIIWILGNLHIG